MLILSPLAAHAAVGLRPCSEENPFRTWPCRAARDGSSSRPARLNKTVGAGDRIDPDWDKSCAVRRRDVGSY